MRINNNCVRRILFEIENLPFGETTTAGKLQEKFPEYSIDEMLTTVTMLNREHFITILDKLSYDDNDVFRDHKIKCLTEKGYRSLDLIRDEETWNLIKENIPNFEEISFFTIFDLATKIMNVKHNKIFGLPDDLLIISNRW